MLLDTSVVNPYLLNLLEYRESNLIEDDEVVESLRAVENYIFRRWVCKVPTNALNKVLRPFTPKPSEGSKMGQVIRKS